MEFKLLKFIQHPDFYNRLQNWSTNPKLTSYPSSSFTNPGLAPVKLYSFYTPLHSQPDLFTIKKKTDYEEKEQFGGGENNMLDNEIDGSDEVNQSVKTSDVDLLEQLKKSKLLNSKENSEDFNEKKRKMINNDDVHNSFLHPSFVKTNTINLSLGDKKTSKKPKIVVTKTEPKKTNTSAIKHNFKFS